MCPAVPSRPSESGDLLCAVTILRCGSPPRLPMMAGWPLMQLLISYFQGRVVASIDSDKLWKALTSNRVVARGKEEQELVSF